MVLVIKRILKPLFGLFLYALGTAFTIQANIGYSPWNVLNAGVARSASISIGTATIATGLVIVTIVALLGEKIGLGTVANMALIGPFLDTILLLGIIPLSSSLPLSIAMLLLGLFVFSLGAYCYISSGFGAGPRDSLMVAVKRKTKLPIGVCRGSIELIAVVSGWLLGGMVGIGTVISIFAQGAFIQLSFRLFKFDATRVQHESLADTFRKLSRR